MIRSGDWAPILQRWPRLDHVLGAKLWIVRDDLLPFPLAGNKIRKLEADLINSEEPFDVVITNGGVDSNHCRTLATMAALHGFQAYLVLHGDFIENSIGLRFLGELNAGYDVGPAESISDRIELARLRFESEGKKVKIISGGGHTPAGAKSFRKAAESVLQKQGFDQIFVASGTGATQGGILAATTVNSPSTKVVGISIARTQNRGVKPVAEAAKWAGSEDNDVIFDDQYMAGGYGKTNLKVRDAVKIGWGYGLPLDPVYTGKAFSGLLDYANKGKLGESVLFWHTGGLANWLAER